LARFYFAVGVNIKKSTNLNLPHISKAEKKSERFRIENFIQGGWSGVIIVCVGGL